MITKSNFASKNASKTSIQSYLFMKKVFRTDLCLLIFKLIILLDCVSYRKKQFFKFSSHVNAPNYLLITSITANFCGEFKSGVKLQIVCV